MTTYNSPAKMVEFWRDFLQESASAWAKAGQGGGANPFELWSQTFQKTAEVWSKASGGKPADPSLFWRQFFGAWSEAWIKALTQAQSPDAFQTFQKLWMDQLEALGAGFAKSMGTEAFAAALGKSMEQTLAAQDRMAKAANPQIDAALRTLNLPSRGQIDRLFERLIGIEERLDNLEQKEREVLRKLQGVNGATAETAAPVPRAAPARRRTARGG